MVTFIEKQMKKRSKRSKIYYWVVTNGHSIYQHPFTTEAEAIEAIEKLQSLEEKGWFIEKKETWKNE
jgi:hypothetical protein